MYDNNMLGAQDALREARACCERIGSALDETSSEAEQIGDRELLKRLTAARAAASRAGELIERLAALLENEQSNTTQ
ncbi:MAG TPA: hypothetical protein VK192_14275 [Sphingomicrobium sp.]|jgi:hypothetical protein|nr:hypothetical protein [Sphingomicrobium sp.]